MVIIISYILLLKLTFKVKYNLVLSSFFHTFWSEGNHQLFFHKIPHKADKIMPFYSDLPPFGALLGESHFYPPNLRDFRYTEASGHTVYEVCP